MKNRLFWLLLLTLNPVAFAVVNDYEFEGTITSVTGDPGAALIIKNFSGHIVYNSDADWFSAITGVANYNFISFSATLSGHGIKISYPDSTFTRRQVRVRNREPEDSDSIRFFADNFIPQTKIFIIELKDFDKTVFPGSPVFPPLPVSLNLADFESRAFTAIDKGVVFEGTVTRLTLIPEPATLLLLGLGAVMLRRKQK